MFIYLACEPGHELGEGYTPDFLQRTLAGTSLAPNLAGLTWPLDSCASTCADDCPIRPTSKTGCSTCPSKHNAEFTHERTAEYVEVR